MLLWLGLGQPECCKHNVFMLKEFEHAMGCAGREHRAADHKATDVVKVEAVDVLVRRYGMQDARQVEGRRQRQLNQNAMPAGFWCRRWSLSPALPFRSRSRRRCSPISCRGWLRVTCSPATGRSIGAWQVGPFSAGARDPCRGAQFVAIHPDVEYDDYARRCRGLGGAPAVLMVKKQRAETIMTRSRARFRQSQQPHGVR